MIRGSPNERDYILERDAEAPVLPAETASFGYLIRQPKVIGMTLGFGAYNYVFYLLLTWLPSYLSLVGGLAFGAALYGASFAHTAAHALVWISIAMAGLGAMAPVGWSIPSFIAPRESVGRVGGIMNFATQIAAISAPVVTGYFARAHNFTGAFAVAAIVLAVGIAGYILGLGKLRVIPEPA
jgi:ACS family D-galactonate transporter-like MFS transporter